MHVVFGVLGACWWLLLTRLLGNSGVLGLHSSEPRVDGLCQILIEFGWRPVLLHQWPRRSLFQRSKSAGFLGFPKIEALGICSRSESSEAILASVTAL